jgi:Holliday junction resolvase
MRRAAKKDANHHEIADGLRADGWSVLDLSTAGNGVPDVVIGKPGRAVLVEIKADDKAKLTPKERAVRANWDGPYIVAWSLDDARAKLKAIFGEAA